MSCKSRPERLSSLLIRHSNLDRKDFCWYLMHSFYVCFVYVLLAGCTDWKLLHTYHICRVSLLCELFCEFSGFLSGQKPCHRYHMWRVFLLYVFLYGAQVSWHLENVCHKSYSNADQNCRSMSAKTSWSAKHLHRHNLKQSGPNINIPYCS